MIYRDLCNEKVSQLGFGCMRFPTLDNDPKQIDKEKSSAMLKEAIDKGVNYLDTAWPYHGEMSELFVGEFLKENNLREEIYLTTKSPVWLCKTYDDFGLYLDKQLKKLQTNYIDFYLLHALDAGRWQKLKEQNIEDFIIEAKGSGKVKHLGFSFHDSLDLFKEICDSNLFDFCQIQLNYMDVNYQAGLEGLQYAHSKGIPVIIMEPLKGGKLAFKIEGALKEIWDKHDVQASPAQLALKFLYNLPEVNLILSGMSTMEQVLENIDTSSTANIGDLSSEEETLIKDIKKYIEEKTKVNCTACKYCIDCPQQIPIYDVFEIINDAHMYDDWDYSKKKYSQISQDKRANNCIECGNCEDQCPQHIDIIEALKKCHEELRLPS
ncbi:aldo/keto reductase [Alkalibaculum bacchi]|uniref:aldo/keto reductase n=1 Tax=Alkalibaculum bacchi TaxID=645887 RepID=UPI0026EDCF1E|nr:aldo/keto reductase [Alkalibaculum bacchi]